MSPKKTLELKRLKLRKRILLERLEVINSKISRMTMIGYRCDYPGDEYNYGGQCDFLIEIHGSRTAALEAAVRSSRGAHGPEPYPIYEDSPPPGRIS